MALAGRRAVGLASVGLTTAVVLDTPVVDRLVLEGAVVCVLGVGHACSVGLEAVAVAGLGTGRNALSV